MRLIVDLDGVVCDFVTEANAWVEREFGYPPIPATHWNWLDGHPDSKMVWRALWTKGVEEGHIFRNVNPLPGAVAAVKRLGELYEVVFATHRPGVAALDDTKEWLENFDLGYFPLCFVEHAEDKAQLPGDFFVDDYPPTVDAILKAEKEAVLFDQPWNREREDLPRVSGWSELEFALTAGFEPDDEWLASLNAQDVS